MTIPPDPTFPDRVKALVDVANSQLDHMPGPRVGASFAFSAARFNVWLCSTLHKSGAEMAGRREEAINALTQQYREMLEENYDDYCQYFEHYTARK